MHEADDLNDTRRDGTQLQESMTARCRQELDDVACDSVMSCSNRFRTTRPSRRARCNVESQLGRGSQAIEELAQSERCDRLNGTRVRRPLTTVP